jgi:hypothetical protein
MPRLLVFAPCEKVIISQADNTATLITVLSGIAAEYEKEGAPPPGKRLSLPIRWTIFSLWKKESTDGDKEFAQSIIFKSPSGENIFETAAMPIDLKVGSHRMVMLVDSVPVWEPGEWKIELYLSEKDAQLPELPLVSYPFDLKMKEKEKL